METHEAGSRDYLEPAEVGGVSVRNRIFRSATEEGLADDAGLPTEALVRKYEALVRGDIGCIITGYIGVSKEGESSIRGMCLLDADGKVPAYRKMVERVHAAGAPVIAQFAHCGRNGRMGRAGKVGRLSEAQIRRIIDDFAAAARRCREAGFDAVQLHCAHVYLLAEFLSPKTNRRRDRWGGSTEGRFRIVSEIMNRIREECPGYPVFVKMNGSEADGYRRSVEEAARVAMLMEQAGVTAIEVSCGINSRRLGAIKGQIPTDMILRERPGIAELPACVKAALRPLVPLVIGKPESDRLYNLEAAQRIKARVSVPVILVGGVAGTRDIEEALAGGMDAVSMCRPLILEPGLVRKFREGKQSQAKCIKCNYCLVGIERHPLRCYYGHLPKEGARA